MRITSSSSIAVNRAGGVGGDDERDRDGLSTQALLVLRGHRQSAEAADSGPVRIGQLPQTKGMRRAAWMFIHFDHSVNCQNRGVWMLQIFV